MKNLLKLEELGMFFLGVFSFSLLNYDWWLLVALFFLPDLGMLGYLAGKKTGALFYNLCHHKGLAIGVFLIGTFRNVAELELAGVVIFTHAAFDRILGYGLKYERGFGFTHLGKIGPEAKHLDADKESSSIL